MVSMLPSIGEFGDTAKTADFEIQMLKRAGPHDEIRIRPDRSYGMSRCKVPGA